MYAITRVAGALCRPTLQFFVSAPFIECHISKLFSPTQSPYNENITGREPKSNSGNPNALARGLLSSHVTMKIKYIAAVLIGLAGLSLQQVKADNSTFFLTTSNIPGFVGPINMVQVSIDTSADGNPTT